MPLTTSLHCSVLSTLIATEIHGNQEIWRVQDWFLYFLSSCELMSKRSIANRLSFQMREQRKQISRISGEASEVLLTVTE